MDIENIEDIPNFLQANNGVLSSIVRDIATWIGAAIYATIRWLEEKSIGKAHVRRGVRRGEEKGQKYQMM